MDTKIYSLSNSKRSKKGVMLTYAVFLLFSSLLYLTFMVAHISTMESDTYSVIVSVARVRNQFDAIEYHFLRLPTTGINISIDNNSITIIEDLPFPITEDTSAGFIAFRDFVENYSLINTTFDSIPELPGQLNIQPQQISLIHPDEYSVVVSPLDNESVAVLESYTIVLEVQGSTPSVEWEELEEAEDDSPSIFLSVTAIGTGNPGRNSSVSAYVDISDDESEVLVSRGANEIMTIILQGEDGPGQIELYLDQKFSATLNTTVTFNSTVSETTGGMIPANASVTIPNVLKKVQIVR